MVVHSLRLTLTRMPQQLQPEADPYTYAPAAHGDAGETYNVHDGTGDNDFDGDSGSEVDVLELEGMGFTPAAVAAGRAAAAVGGGGGDDMLMSPMQELIGLMLTPTSEDI